MARHYARPDKPATAHRGRIVCTPSPGLITASEGDVIMAWPVAAGLDFAGRIHVELLATDNTDVRPTDWTYEVTELLHGAPARSYHVFLPQHAPTIDLADIAPSNPTRAPTCRSPDP
ncbi:hypothetical protein [Streptomyces sp. N35]|uniref:hypothetical protein n=1 Tax=Streptomyces sp. N35 TaxID=2795730 RepID=UPI0018F2E15F|nr:hypothetical protein [Streptomyces sp. N35]